MPIKNFDYGEIPETLQREREKLLVITNPTALKRSPQQHQTLSPIVAPRFPDEPPVILSPQESRLPEFSIRIENDILGFDFFIYEYQILDYAIICVLDKRNFNLTPKSNQQFNLIIDKQTFPVYYIGQPQYLKVFDKSLLFFLRNLDND